MHLGIGLYRSLLNSDNYRFAVQAGATHLVIQLVDYIQGGEQPDLTRNYLDGWGHTDQEDQPWTFDLLQEIKDQAMAHGLHLAAIENLDPAHWYDVLLAGPKRDDQIEGIKQLILIMGKLEIPILGYYFSLAGVWGWTPEVVGRGDAHSIVFDEKRIDPTQAIPDGMVWNMTYRSGDAQQFIATVDRDEMWSRLSYFLDRVLPVAEEAGVRLVAHPDDPPMTPMRQTARLFTTIEDYQELIKRHPSPANGFECCLGTLQEMQKTGKDVYQFVDEQSATGRIGYIHFRNVVGQVPCYREAFADEGDLDMVRIMKILQGNNYPGVLIPDHTPEMTCGAPWHAGMAYAMGYLKGLMQSLPA